MLGVRFYFSLVIFGLLVLLGVCFGRWLFVVDGCVGVGLRLGVLLLIEFCGLCFKRLG